jgi:hypothetical protein
MELVQLPEGTVVEVQAPEEGVDVRALVPPGTDEGLIRIYEILVRRRLGITEAFTNDRHFQATGFMTLF